MIDMDEMKNDILGSKKFSKKLRLAREKASLNYERLHRLSQIQERSLNPAYLRKFKRARK